MWLPRPKRPKGGSISASHWKFCRREAEYRATNPSRARDLPLPVRNPLPQPAGLRPRTGRHRRRRHLQRRLARVDHHRPPPGRAGRFLRHDLRPQRAVSQRPRGRPKNRSSSARRKAKSPWPTAAKIRLYLFAALQRHLGYPGVPRPKAGRYQSLPHPAIATKDGTPGNAHQAARRRTPRRHQSCRVSTSRQEERRRMKDEEERMMDEG